MEAKFIERIADHLRADAQVYKEGSLRIGDRVFRLFERAGVADRIAELPKERFEIVADGVVALWKIDSIGKHIERKDEEKIRGSEKSSESVNEAVRKRVKGELEEIGRSYHGFNEWLPESVRQLVKTALEKDSKKMYLHKEGIMFSPDHYIIRLRNSGRFYQDVISGVYPPEERASMDTYIKTEREESLHQMRTTFNVRLGNVVAGLQPLPQINKK
jgi:hypothetical protein